MAAKIALLENMVVLSVFAQNAISESTALIQQVQFVKIVLEEKLPLIKEVLKQQIAKTVAKEIIAIQVQVVNFAQQGGKDAME